MAKKAPAKPRAKRKPRPKKPVDAVIIDAIRQHIAEDPFDNATPKSIAWRSWLGSGAKAVALIAAGVTAGVYAAGGIDISPGPGRNDSLSQAHAADRVSQVAVLHELAAQPFDGATDEGRKQAGEWFNAQRFRNRANDFGTYTDAVSEAIAGNAEAELAEELENK